MAKPNVAVSSTVEPRTVDMPPFSVRADLVRQSINEEERTVELVFTTGAPVLRMDWWSGKQYVETLSLENGSVRLDRLNDGGPLLDSHSYRSIADQIGAVVK